MSQLAVHYRNILILRCLDNIPYADPTPFVAVITLQLLEQGLIQGLDDPIWQYHESYHDCLPPHYAEASLTWRHLLLHTGGLPDNSDAPVWHDGNRGSGQDILARVPVKDLAPGKSYLAAFAVPNHHG